MNIKVKKLLLLLVLLLSFPPYLHATIKIGALLDLSGPTLKLCQPYAAGIRNYINNLNENGGINGEIVQLIVKDTAYKPLQAITKYKELKAENVGIIIGWGTGPSITISKLAAKDKIVLIPASFFSKLVEPLNPYTFLAASTYTEEMLSLINYAKSKKKWFGKTKVAFVFNSSAFGTAPIPLAKKRCEKYNIEIVGEEIVELNATEADAQMLRLKKLKPDYVLIQETISATIAILKSAQKVGLKTTFLGTFYCGDNLVLKKAKDAAKELIVCSPFSRWADQNVPGLNLVKKINAKYNPNKTEQPVYYVQGIFVSDIIKQALENATDYSGEAIKHALETTKFDTYSLTATPFGYSKDRHIPTNKVKFYKANPETMKFELISDWEKI